MCELIKHGQHLIWWDLMRQNINFHWDISTLSCGDTHVWGAMEVERNWGVCVCVCVCVCVGGGGGGACTPLLLLAPPPCQRKEHFWQPTNQPPGVICHRESVGRGSGVWRGVEVGGKGKRKRWRWKEKERGGSGEKDRKSDKEGG